MTINKVINFSNLAALFIPCQQDMPKRRYDLDWLRILVFGLLILFHSGMFYVENWPWHVKSTYLSQFLENIMLIIEPWRMPVLWIIAGIAIRFVMAKVSVARFIIMRSYRLLLPLLFGVLVIVPPQLYVEMSYNGDINMNYWQFLQEFFSSQSVIFTNYQSGIWPHIDVNHLWFIRALWQYSLLLICLLPVLNSRWISSTIHWLFKQHSILAIFLAVLPIFIIQTHWDISSARYPLGFTLMIYGYLIGWNTTFWQRISNNIKPLLVASVFFYCTFILFYNLVWLDEIKHGQQNNTWLTMLGMFNYSLLRILGVLTVFAVSAKYLNKNSKKLSYFNDAVYPFYILHQTFIIVIGFNLSKLQLGPVLEPILLISLTIFACFFGYECIRRTELLKPFFGLKMTYSFNSTAKRLGYAAASLMILPLAWEIIL